MGAGGAGARQSRLSAGAYRHRYALCQPQAVARVQAVSRCDSNKGSLEISTTSVDKKTTAENVLKLF